MIYGLVIAYITDPGYMAMRSSSDELTAVVIIHHFIYRNIFNSWRRNIMPDLNHRVFFRLN